MGLKHAKVSAVADTADTTLIQPSNWNAEHVIAGGNLGALLYQGTAGAPSLINSVALGQVLVSAGAGSVPVWRTELQVTASAVTSAVPILIPDGTAAAPALALASEPTSGWYNPTSHAGAWVYVPSTGSGVGKFMVLSAYVGLSSATSLAWASTIDVEATADVILSRGAANRLTLEVGDVFNHAPTAFASLPAGAEGDIACVTDSSTATWGATITGGGANNVLAFFNGTNWTVAGA